MHELSIALNIIEIVNETFAKTDAKKVNDIELEIGKFSGVELNALEFALETSMEQTHLKEAKVDIISVEGKGKCRNCSKLFLLRSLYDDCPGCGSSSVDLISGRELRVKSINVD